MDMFPTSEKKKKKSRERTLRETSEAEVVSAGHGQDLDVGDREVKKKHKKHRKSSMESSEVGCQADAQEARTTKKGKKLKLRAELQEVLQVGDPQIREGETEVEGLAEIPFPPLKKKKRKCEAVLEDFTERDGTLPDVPSAELKVLLRGSEKPKKKKKRLKASLEDSAMPDVEEVPELTCSPAAAMGSSGREEDVPASAIWDSAGATFLGEPDVDNSLIASKKRKKKKHKRDRSQERGFVLSTESISEATREGKTKKHGGETQQAAEISSESETPAVKSAKKDRKKKHKTLQERPEEEISADVTEESQLDMGGSNEPTSPETRKKKKKKSRKRRRSEEARELDLPGPDCDTRSGADKVAESGQSERSGDSTTRARKKKKKRAEDEEPGAEDGEPGAEVHAETDQTIGMEEGLENRHVNEEDGRLDDSAEVTDDTVFSRPGGRQKSGRRARNVAHARKKDLRILEEFFPNLKKLKASTVCLLLSEDLERVKVAKKKGITFQSGRFTTEENKQLTKNVEEFMALTGITDAEKLFCSYKYPEEKSVINKLKKMYNFSYRIAEGIPRTVHEVSHRGRKLFDTSSNKGRFSEEEVRNLKKGWSLHGNKWTTVGNLVGRNNVAVQLKASQLRREINRGAWSNEELNRLVSAVKTFVLDSLDNDDSEGKNPMGTNREAEAITKEKLYKGIPWVQIEEQVQTRNWTQCRTKWIDILFLRMNNGVNVFQGASGLEARINLIKWLHDSGLEESGQVKWEEVADYIGNIPPTVVQVKFFYLKCTHVPNWQKLSFKEIVDHLYTVVLPELESKLHKMQSRKTHQIQEVTK
ncbi:hypothetical protein FKM82_005518 [Ascaphus truei]